MTVEVGLALVGIVISVVLGIAGFFLAKTVRKKWLNQRATAKNGSMIIQAGRDVNRRQVKLLLKGNLLREVVSLSPRGAISFCILV
jgi:hypothetical protein